MTAKAAVDQHGADLLEVVRAAIERGQGALAAGHLGCRDGYRMWQALRIHRDVNRLAELLSREIPGAVGVCNDSVQF